MAAVSFLWTIIISVMRGTLESHAKGEEAAEGPAASVAPGRKEIEQAVAAAASAAQGTLPVALGEAAAALKTGASVAATAAASPALAGPAMGPSFSVMDGSGGAAMEQGPPGLKALADGRGGGHGTSSL